MAKYLLTPEQKAKRASYMRLWREKDPERWTAIARRARKKWREANRGEEREINRRLRYRVRQEILDLLGGQKCKQCGFDDWRGLEIDHIHGDGKDDRGTLSGLLNVFAFRNKLLKPGFLATALLRYQVLCCNCNQIKRFINREFPMKDPNE